VRFAFNPFIGFGPTREAAIAEARRLLVPSEPDADRRKLESRVGPAMMSGCIGHPDEVLAQIDTYHAMGIELLLLKFPPNVEAVEQIRRWIIEPLRAGGDGAGTAA
jgi:alkanesulfonate monooxygenase SsuD/methylene tetrahydromethanopterin reductase-like flavin-dependent oxidoreductase (luciferase family)